MATQNATITSAWSKIADSADDPFLAQPFGSSTFQIATMATETAPTVEGHVIKASGQAISRDLIGAGHVYARVVSGAPSATLVVSGSSETLS
jgi:hypothetical protein